MRLKETRVERMVFRKTFHYQALFGPNWSDHIGPTQDPKLAAQWHF